MKAFKGAKAKVIRRFGVNIFEANKYDAILNKRNYPPGVHGPKKRGAKISEYGRQLIEKQKMKLMYGLTERQFHNFYDKAERQKGATGLNLLKLLETRIDNIIFRSGWATTRAQARQIVNHNHVTLDGKKANIPSMHVKIGCFIEMKQKDISRSLINSCIEENQWRAVPSWINSNKTNSTIKIVNEPTREEMPQFVNEQLIVELYSK